MPTTQQGQGKAKPKSRTTSKSIPGDTARRPTYFLRKRSPQELDPRLQGALLCREEPKRIEQILKSAVTPVAHYGESHPTTQGDGGTGNGENPWIDVLFRLNDASQVDLGDDFRIYCMMGAIGTGAVRLNNILKVRGNENVKSLKVATELRLQLKYSVQAIRCTATDFKEAFPPKGLDGTNVILGIVDRGCDFVHRNFRCESGYTRLLYLWDQRTKAKDEDKTHWPRGFEYGREFDSARIDGALLQPDPYSDLKYKLAAGSHGTHVMDIAAGNGNGTGRPGVAPKADLIFVDLAGGDEDGSTQAQAARRFGTEEHLGNSRYLLEAVAYIFGKAKELGRPCVVNLSLGTYGGPHDGSTLVEMGFEELLKEPGRAIVISAGNAGDLDIHASDSVTQARSKCLVWQFEPTAQGEEECEIWYDVKGEGLILGLKAPDGTPVLDENGAAVTVLPGTTYELRRRVGDKTESCGYVVHRANDPNHDGPVNQVNLRLPAPAEGSPKSLAWTIEISTESPDEIEYDAWIDDGSHSSFGEYDRESTLGALCCSANTIVVGAFDARMANAVALDATSLGPTRDGKAKPEVSAPGAGVCAACSRSHSGLLELSGTSMAAPHVAGLIALLFELTGPMTIAAMRRQLIKKDPIQSSGWNNPYGYGRVDGVAAALALTPNPPASQRLTAKNGNGNGGGGTPPPGTQPPILQLIDSQGIRWQAELKPMP
jgi:subtilisin family serine protease